MNYIIDNGIVVSEGAIGQRTVAIVDGRFADADEAGDAVHIDATGCYVLPGVIDTHVHFREPGLTEKADMGTESRAAVAGGVTSIIDMPNTIPQTTSLATLEEKGRLAADHCVVNYGFMLGATNDNIGQLLAIAPQRYAAIKLFLGSSTGNMLVNDAAQLDRLFGESRKLIVAHCEEEQIVQANMATYRAQYEGTPDETAALHPKIRSSEACFESTYKAIARARRYGTRFHVAHLTTATELSLLSNQDIDQKHITAEVTPNHLWFDDRDYATLGNLIKCNPAIKSNDDRLALWAALHDGRLDTIATDHAPHTWESKQKNYFAAPGGIPSIQHSLQMMLEPLFNDSVEETERAELIEVWLPLIVEKMCHNPARIFGIRERGYVRKGYHADLVIVRPQVPVQVTKSTLRYKCGWSPLEGKTFHSQIVTTFVNGTPYSEGVNSAQPLQFSK
ncbi:MAG: dihydroorotase [Bacteroidales bacterium]|nr:dihydroorotase [Bacteroidales bacterium]